jgi:hypothetical protein
METNSYRDWSDIERRVLTALARANVVVRESHRRPGAYYGHLQLDLQIRDRFRAAMVIEGELGSEFIARYHRHPEAIPQGAVFVFQADRAYSEECWERSNVHRRRR